ncbi:MAG: RseA family anti-sigma factor [Glaciecola sp.]
MTQEYENVSAMVDGEELKGNEQSALTKNIIGDPVLKAKWQSYHLTRDLLRNDMSADMNFDISDKVAAALEDELSIVAPKPGWRDLPVVSAVLPIMKQSGQLAMVACVTALVIFGFQTYNKPEASTPFNTAPPVLGPQGGMAPVSLQRSNSLQGSSSAQQDRMTQLLEQRRQINALIQDHERQLKLKNIKNQGLESSAVESEANDATKETPPTN